MGSIDCQNHNGDEQPGYIPHRRVDSQEDWCREDKCNEEENNQEEQAKPTRRFPDTCLPGTVRVGSLCVPIDK